MLLKIIQNYPLITVTLLFLSCNFRNLEKELITRKWFVISGILSLTYFAGFLLLWWGDPNYIGVEEKDLDAARSYRLHYFTAPIIVGHLSLLRGKMLVKKK